MSAHELPDLSLITVKVLGDTLADLHSRSKELRGPILYLEAVSSRLRRAGVKDTREARATALAELLRELAWTGLCAARGAVNGSCPPMSTDHFPEGMAADFAAGSKIREYWSAVWYRFLGEASPTKEEMAQVASMDRTTFWRRWVDGTKLLHEMLIAAELKARKGLVSPDVPPAPVADAAQRTRAEAILARVKQRLADDRSDALSLDAAERRLILGWSWDSLDMYRLRQALIWSDERFKLDERFVDLSLLVDLGEDAPTERWQLQERRYDSLEAVLAEQPDPAFVVLGAPGSGKSTLLRHHELGIMLDGLRGVTNRISIFVPLSRYGSQDSELAPLPPLTWLAAEWQAAHPGLPSLIDLLAGQEVTLLLDAVNEMPHRDAGDYQSRVSGWRQLVEDLADRQPGNRVIFSCRSLDYSAPLSSKVRAVPQLRLEALDDARVQAFLGIYCPKQADRIWEEFKDKPQLVMLRTPFLLRMLAQQAMRDSRPVTGRAALFSSFIRGTLRNEVQGDNPRFAVGPLLSDRDRRKILTQERWPRPFDLPGDGLFRPLSQLAYAMQDQHGSSEAAQIRLSYDDALAKLEAALVADHADAVLHGGCDLGLLDQDRSLDELLFRHQLLQEYFAARRLAREPHAELAASEWRADRISPTVEELIQTLAPAEPLPPLATTGWEETMLLAGAMADEQDRFVDGLAETNLPLAGRCAAQAESKVSEPARERLRWALVERSRDPRADLRARIAAGEALGELGDPRFKRCVSAEGVEYLLPPMVRVPGGTYFLELLPGPSSAVTSSQSVVVGEFLLGQFAVTNAEYACFIYADGYDDERWWRGSAARSWWQGEGTDDWSFHQDLQFYRQFKREPHLLDAMKDDGSLPASNYRRWMDLVALSEDSFLRLLRKKYPGGRKHSPRYWGSDQYNLQNHPTVGVSLYECIAYARFLAHHSKSPFQVQDLGHRQIATHVAMTKVSAREANNVAIHMARLGVVGIFGSTTHEETICDLNGNILEWTESPIVRTQDDGIMMSATGVESRDHYKCGTAWYQPPQALGYAVVGNDSSIRARDSGFRLVIDSPTQ